jgi:DNA modification methylase
MKTTLRHGDCLSLFRQHTNIEPIDLTFLDPPFNQDKEYNAWNDNLPDEEYWGWMRDVCKEVHAITSDGGAIYFMQREKNSESVLRCLRESGWTFQNLIVWKKKTSAVPAMKRYGKHYQIIAFGTKGKTPRLFNRLRIDPPLPAGYKYQRENGMFVTDVWDDIREMTSGYFAGDEALYDAEGIRAHKQQSPIQLLIRIILSSTGPGDVVLDPFAGSGTTLVVASQLNRKSIGIELDPHNVKIITERLTEERKADNVSRFLKDYTYTSGLEEIWGDGISASHNPLASRQTTLFEKE